MTPNFCNLKQLAAVGLFFSLAGLTGCASNTIPPDALLMKEPATEIRQRQARRYATTDEKQVIIAASQLLQDLGFNVENSAKDLGLLVVSKDRSAVDGGQVAGQIVVAVLFGVRVPVDKEQKIRASVVTWPSADRKAIDVRVTFQRLVWDDRGQLSKLERLDDPEMYQDFYIKLSKALFLEAQEVG